MSTPLDTLLATFKKHFLLETSLLSLKRLKLNLTRWKCLDELNQITDAEDNCRWRRDNHLHVMKLNECNYV